jgi:hypothetical protein
MAARPTQSRNGVGYCHQSKSPTFSEGEVNGTTQGIRLSDEQRLDWLRLIRSQSIGPRGIMAQTPQGA